MTRSPVFGKWSDLETEVVRPGVERAGFGTDDVMLVMNTLQQGMDLAPHRHEFDQIACVVAGEAIYHVGDTGYRMTPGTVLLVPAGALHYIEPVGDEPVLNLDVFAPARADYAHLVEWMAGASRTEEGDRP